MLFKTNILSVCIFLFCGVCSAARDVNNVSFRGDSTIFGMKIEKTYFAEGSFLVVTTGARFEYVPGELKIYQGLRNDIDRRLVATLTIEEAAKFEKVDSTDDHVLFWSENLNIGIYGCSTCIIAPKVKLNIKCKGNFKPDYEGRYKGELLLIDDKGGMEIYPQRYEAGYEVKKIELGKKDWIAEYQLNANERVMIATFPGKEFDWDMSFKSNVIINSAGFDKSKSPFQAGILPSDSLLTQWSNFFNLVVLFYNSVYKNRQPGGPYNVANETEYKRVIQAAHSKGMKVATYTSFFYHFRKFKTIEPFFEQIKILRDKYGIDGVYIDGLLFDQDPYKIDNKIANWEMVRRLSQLFGSDGVIVFHGTHLGGATATVPNIDSYCTITYTGEGVKFKDANDPYVKYQVRKYGISNTIGSWITYSTPDVLTERQLIDAHINMNGRKLYSEYDFTQKKEADFKYYLKQIAILKKNHYKNN